MTRILSIVAVCLSIGTARVAAQSPLPSASACTQWNVAGSWVLAQSNGPVVQMELRQTDGALSGTAKYTFKGTGGGLMWTPFGGEADGIVEGTITGASLSFSIKWDKDNRTGQYVARVEPTDHGLRGRTFDPADANSRATFKGSGAAVCTSIRPAPADRNPSQVPNVGAETRPVKGLGKASWTATAKDDVDIYNGPGGEFTVVGVMNAGTSVPIVGQKDDWYQLKLANVPGGSGWVAGDHLTTVLIRPARPK